MNSKDVKGKDIDFKSIPALSVEDAVDKLTNMYGSVINSHMSLGLLPSVMMWGPPGAGKSQAVRQIADKLAAITNRKTFVTDVRLILFNPIDLRGIPTANDDRTRAVWLKPEIFDMDPSDSIINILFLDEITSAPQSVQAAAYQITLDRTIGEHRLPDNCIVIAAGNRVTDKSVAYKMPKALANRLMHIEISVTMESWHRWAVMNGINEKVTGFLSFRPDRLMTFDRSGDDVAFATPRSWEKVSNILNYVDGDVSKVHALISGIIGMGTAMEFSSWARVYNKLPDIEDIFNGRNAAVPKSPDALYALISGMAKYAYEHRGELSRIANSIRYASRLPPDFSAILLKDYIFLEEGYKERLLTIPEFVSWAESHGKLLSSIR